MYSVYRNHSCAGGVAYHRVDVWHPAEHRLQGHFSRQVPRVTQNHQHHLVLDFAIADTGNHLAVLDARAKYHARCIIDMLIKYIFMLE